MVMQFGDNQEFEDDDVMMCVCMDYDDNNAGGVSKAPGNDVMPSLGDPPVISCHLLLRFLDDALNMIRYVSGSPLSANLFQGIWMVPT